MKKRYFAIAAVLLATLICLAACNGSGEMMNAITNALRADYSQATVTVQTEKGDVKLVSTYEITFDGDNASVEYNIQKLHELNWAANPDNPVETFSGTAHYVNGILVDGDHNANLSSGELDFTGFRFKQNFFTNVKTSESAFSADVVNAKAFVGNASFDGTNMKVYVKLNADKLAKFSLNYLSANGSDVAVIYEFTA